MNNPTPAQADRVAAAFSQQAAVFDAIEAPNAILHWMRGRVRRHVLDLLPPGSHLLELNAGTGLDAAFFAGQGHRVHTRSCTAWYHHMALSLMAMHFRLKTQLEGDEAMSYLSFASIKLLLAQKLRNKLAHDDALMRAISKRSSYLKSTKPQTSGAT